MPPIAYHEAVTIRAVIPTELTGNRPTHHFTNGGML